MAHDFSSIDNELLKFLASTAAHPTTGVLWLVPEIKMH